MAPQDPWDVAAKRITDDLAEKHRRAEQAEEQEQAEQAAAAAKADDTYREMKAAIAEAVPRLAEFLTKRGQAACRLLAAYGERTHVMFGGDQEGGYYNSVLLDGTGLRYEAGTISGYTSSPTQNRPATPQEAVEAYAFHGSGQGKPQRVRDIVGWVTEQLDAYSRQ